MLFKGHPQENSWKKLGNSKYGPKTNESISWLKDHSSDDLDAYIKALRNHYIYPTREMRRKVRERLNLPIPLMMELEKVEDLNERLEIINRQYGKHMSKRNNYDEAERIIHGDKLQDELLEIASKSQKLLLRIEAIENELRLDYPDEMESYESKIYDRKIKGGVVPKNPSDN